MSVVRRRSVAAGVVAGVVLLAGPAWAQEDPCAPGPDGQVPEMCQSGPASDTGTVGIEPEHPCPPQPVEPGDGPISSDEDQGIAVGEPNPGAPPPDDVAEEPASEPDRVDPEQADPATTEDTSRAADSPGAIEEDGVICAFAVPVAAPGGATPESAPAGELPRTGPYDRLLALTALGSGLVVAGLGAAAAGRRRSA